MTVTERFFVECIKNGINDEKVEFIPECVDYKQFYKLCASHSMSVVVYRAIQGVRDKMPEGFVNALEKSVQRHVMKDIQSEFDIKTVLDAFEEKGIRFMPLKGYHLKKLYPSTDMRYASDCDVLIDVEQLKEVRAIVDGLGLETKRYDEHHDIVYYPETKTVFELHKTIFVGELEKYFGVQNQGFKRAKIKEGCKNFYEMDKELFYISILAHSAYHFAEGAGVGIRHLTDVYLYRKAYDLDENYLNEELKKCGLLQFKEQFEKVSSYFFKNEKGDEFTVKLAKHILNSTLFAYERLKSASDVAQNLSESSDKKARKKTFWKKVFLPVEQMKFSFPVLKKAIWLLPFCHVIRWIKVIFTRPKAIGQLKEYNKVENQDLLYMKHIIEGLGINHL